MSDELNEAQEGMAKVGAMLALAVENALQHATGGPSNGRVQTCLHMGELASHRRTTAGKPVPEEGSRDVQVFVCPFHPEHGLLCDTADCVSQHYAHEHHGEFDEARCFACEAPMLDPITGMRDDFTPVFAEVTLHSAVRVWTPSVRTSRSSYSDTSYVGDLATLPVAYLCPLHADLVELPIRMGWPMGDRIAS